MLQILKLNRHFRLKFYKFLIGDSQTLKSIAQVRINMFIYEIEKKLLESYATLLNNNQQSIVVQGYS